MMNQSIELNCKLGDKEICKLGISADFRQAACYSLLWPMLLPIPPPQAPLLSFFAGKMGKCYRGAFLCPLEPSGFLPFWLSLPLQAVPIRTSLHQPPLGLLVLGGDLAAHPSNFLPLLVLLVP